MDNSVLKQLQLIDELTEKLKVLLKEYAQGELGQIQTIYASLGYISYLLFSNCTDAKDFEFIEKLITAACNKGKNSAEEIRIFSDGKKEDGEG